MRSKKANITLNCNNDCKKFTISNYGAELNEENYRLSYHESDIDNCIVGSLDIDIRRSETWDNTGLNSDNSVILELEVLDVPDKITCLYMYSEWWTRPSFVEHFIDVPDKTQIALCKYNDHYTCVLPMVGDIYKAQLYGSSANDKLCLHLSSGINGLRSVNEIVFIAAEGRTVCESINKVFDYLHKEYDIQLRSERKFSEIFQYLGWCSWDAFYKEINEDKFKAKAKEFVDKNIPVKWMLFDDGWMNGHDDMLCGFEPDEDKFKRGLGPVINEIKSESNIEWFGVWHAFGGYWAGVDPDSQLAKKEKDHLYKTRNGRLVPGPFNGSGFYKDWYQYLKKENIDFVKVDGQSALPIYYKDDIPVPIAARGMSSELEKGSEILNQNVINCMGMAMENIVSRPVTGISRNSDDFVPKRENGFAEHLIQNAYNALYHNKIYYCDWDMFWTTHPDAEKHAVLRAISGGPVYFSDRIGESNLDIISKLCFMDGRLPLMDRSAMVSEDSIFVNPLTEGVLKVQNVATLDNGEKVGVIAIFNLTDDIQTAVLSSNDIPELDNDKKYWIYDYRGKKSFLLESNNLDIRLNTGEYGYYILIPDNNGFASLGLSDKYVGFMGAQCETIDDYVVNMHVRESGKISWLSLKKPISVIVNDIDYTNKLSCNGYVQELNLKDIDEPVDVRITFNIKKEFLS